MAFRDPGAFVTEVCVPAPSAARLTQPCGFQFRSEARSKRKSASYTSAEDKENVNPRANKKVDVQKPVERRPLAQQPSLTIPAAPSFATDLRLRVTRDHLLGAKRELRSLQQKAPPSLVARATSITPKFKARPLNKKIFEAGVSGTFGIPISTKIACTQPRAFNFHTEIRAPTAPPKPFAPVTDATQKIAFDFAATFTELERPVKKPRASVPAQLTQPKSPKFHTSRRSTMRTPLPQTRQQQQKSLSVNPVSFRLRTDMRGEIKTKSFTERLLQEEAAKEELQASARLARNTVSPMELVVPQPFNFHTEARAASKAELYQQILAQEEREAEARRFTKTQKRPHPFSTQSASWK